MADLARRRAGFYIPVVVSESGCIQERLTLCTVDRIRSRGGTSSHGSAPGCRPSPPAADRYKAKATARARLERLVLQQHAIRMGDQQREMDRAADEEALPAQGQAPLRRRADAADLASPEPVTGGDGSSPYHQSPASVVPLAIAPRPWARNADDCSVKSLPSSPLCSPLCSPLWQRGARRLATSSGAECLRLPRLSKEGVAEHYLAKSLGHLASPGA